MLVTTLFEMQQLQREAARRPLLSVHQGLWTPKVRALAGGIESAVLRVSLSYESPVFRVVASA